MHIINRAIAQIPITGAGIIMHVIQLLIAEFFSSAFLPSSQHLLALGFCEGGTLRHITHTSRKCIANLVNVRTNKWGKIMQLST